jgi:hypothetical protein
MHFHLFWITPSTLNISPPLQSCQENDTDVTCTAVCNNILNIVFQCPVALIYEHHFTHFQLTSIFNALKMEVRLKCVKQQYTVIQTNYSIYLSFWVSTCGIKICIPHAAHLSYKELVWVTSEMIFLSLRSILSMEANLIRLPVRFYVPTAVAIKGANIWDVMP